MSILIDGVHTSNISVSQSSPGTLLSNAFVRSRLPPRSSLDFALTISGGPHGAFTVTGRLAFGNSLSASVCGPLTSLPIYTLWIRSGVPVCHTLLYRQSLTEFFFASSAFNKFHLRHSRGYVHVISRYFGPHCIRCWRWPFIRFDSPSPEVLGV
ncbi:hypothetical protein C8R44DRAFT_874333 [Mycena epipterygia]|nr:hypothetical protein C8R44DRAFT_874333 [Mycena epipterygia]